MAGSGKAPALGGVSARAPLGFPGPRPGRHRRQGAQTEEGTEDPTKARGELGPGLEAGLAGLVWGGGRLLTLWGEVGKTFFFGHLRCGVLPHHSSGQQLPRGRRGERRTKTTSRVNSSHAG